MTERMWLIIGAYCLPLIPCAALGLLYLYERRKRG